MIYHWYELGHAAMVPARAVAGSARSVIDNPFNPFLHSALTRHASAALELFERTTRRYAKPTFGLTSTTVDGETVGVMEEVVWRAPFCNLIHFKRSLAEDRDADDPRVLLVAPMSGHYATLLRGTVEALLPEHDVYITDWADARMVPYAKGRFDLDDYIDYVQRMLALFKGDVHVFAVCQPSVPVLAAVALMEDDGDPNVPHSVILAGGPVDTRCSPTAVNDVAQQRGTAWFAHNVVTSVPWTQPGSGRLVYPGFMQLTGFMAMNLDRHANAHKQLFDSLVKGDGDSAEKHRAFYDEYLAVMDLTGEFYLQTIDSVFVEHLLPRGGLRHRGQRVDLSAIRRVAIMTVEGEKDDITGRGQCSATLSLTTRLADDKKFHYEAAGVGHYGIFNGSRFTAQILPRIAQFVRTNDDDRCAAIPSSLGRKRVPPLAYDDGAPLLGFTLTQGPRLHAAE